MMDRLVDFRDPDEGIHPFWHLGQKIDLKAKILARADQRAYLARYGRQDFFADRTIVEIESAVRAISALVGEENALSKAAENAG
jgi:hypothetical protein